MNTRDWLARLAAIDTTSRLSNLGLIETVRDDLRGRGLDPWLTRNAEGTKANLFCTLPTQDGGTQGGIALSGHTDTVPVDGQNWTSDPFQLTERDGRLYARGSCDMKGFIACAMALVPEFLALPRRKPLHLAFSYDEEVACIGAPAMLAELQARGVRVDGCIVGEPTSM
jgi:acetylornithine deacetylase